MAHVYGIYLHSHVCTYVHMYIHTFARTYMHISTQYTQWTHGLTATIGIANLRGFPVVKWAGAVSRPCHLNGLVNATVIESRLASGTYTARGPSMECSV